MEKFLELNSEQNHDDYCLAYVFTDRDFDDGVLGLAWVGAPSGTDRWRPQHVGGGVGGGGWVSGLRSYPSCGVITCGSFGGASHLHVDLFGLFRDRLQIQIHVGPCADASGPGGSRAALAASPGRFETRFRLKS